MRRLFKKTYLKGWIIVAASFLMIIPEPVVADAFGNAQMALERLRQHCYPDIDAERIAMPEISVDGVVVEVGVGGGGGTSAYIVSPERLTCDGKSVGLCGSRGCQIRVFAEDDSFSYIGWSPEAFAYGDSIFLLLPHSGWVCGVEHNNASCFSVLFWNDASHEFVYR